MELTERILSAAEYLRNKIPEYPRIGMILGSGLGDYAQSLEDIFVFRILRFLIFPFLRYRDTVARLSSAESMDCIS